MFRSLAVRSLLATMPVLVSVLVPGPALAGEAIAIAIAAKDTVAVVEMDHGDELLFTLRSGRTVSLVLEDTAAAIVERVEPGGIVYRFSCRVRVDGQPLTLRRFVCSQECFYEPYVVDGLRIWPDTVKAVFDLVPVRYPREGNLQCRPRKAARFAVQDAQLRVCPPETHPWLDEPENFLDVARCYNGDDCYLGPYLGQACHVGLDLNHRSGSLLLAPIDFDTQAYFNSLAAGHENNRWRGIRRWPNGDVWALQTHHLIELLVPQNTPLQIGTRYASTAGVHVGSHEHTHFEFKIGRKNADRPLPASADPASIACPVDFDDASAAVRNNPEVLHLDPWVLFWQIFEDRRARRGELRAAMRPLAAARTGEPVAFAAEVSGAVQAQAVYRWTFGDGSHAMGAAATHVFACPGVYPVTLTADDGLRRAACTQHIAVGGPPIERPVLAVGAPDEPSFRVRPVAVADVYGWPVGPLPHTLLFVARPSRPIPDWKLLSLRNLGGGQLADMSLTVEENAAGSSWLNVATSGAGNEQIVHVGVDAGGLAPGRYVAGLSVHCPAAVNSPQPLQIALEVRGDFAKGEATVDDRDAGFYATPYFWVGHRFSRCPPARRGHGSFYLSNGSDPAEGEFARFTPDLQAGRYRVSLSDATPFPTGTEFDVRIRHRGGESTVRVCPDQSRRIGEYEFDEGADGFVEIQAGGSRGLVLADAVNFRRE